LICRAHGIVEEDEEKLSLGIFAARLPGRWEMGDVSDRRTFYVVSAHPLGGYLDLWLLGIISLLTKLN
jgi:hypothetical protein